MSCLSRIILFIALPPLQQSFYLVTCHMSSGISGLYLSYDKYRSFLAYDIYTARFMPSFLPLGHFHKLRCTVSGVSDVGHNVVGLLEHPFIAPGDKKAWVDGFDFLQKHGARIIMGYQTRLVSGVCVPKPRHNGCGGISISVPSKPSAQSHRILLAGQRKTYQLRVSRSD